MKGKRELNLGSSVVFFLSREGSLNLQALEIKSTSIGMTTIEGAILKLNS